MAFSAARIASLVAAFLALASPAYPITFLYTGSLATYVVPATRWYELTVAGAQGGYGFNPNTLGGYGALISGNMFLTSGTELTILVGGGGQGAFGDTAGAGGGMSFIIWDQATPIIVAGGGGGSNWSGGNGGPGQIGTSGQGTYGGTNGFGGTSRASGAGLYGDGANSSPDNQMGGGGRSWPTFAGGAPSLGDAGPPYINSPGSATGGFGGGGGGGYSCGGGGGGYSGGQGGVSLIDGDLYTCAGGGGGSFVSPLLQNVFATPGANGIDVWNDWEFGQDLVFNGYVSIEFSSLVPEPSTWAMMILGFGLCGAMLRRRRTAIRACTPQP